MYCDLFSYYSLVWSYFYKSLLFIKLSSFYTLLVGAGSFLQLFMNDFVYILLAFEDLLTNLTDILFLNLEIFHSVNIQKLNKLKFIRLDRIKIINLIF
jgi:hypothetical protein